MSVQKEILEKKVRKHLNDLTSHDYSNNAYLQEIKLRKQIKKKQKTCDHLAHLQVTDTSVFLVCTKCKSLIAKVNF